MYQEFYLLAYDAVWYGESQAEICMLLAFLFGLVFNAEDEDMFLRNVC
jgi:hypothetical protein